MPTPPLSDEVLEATYNTFLEAGKNYTYTASALGLSRSGVQDRVRAHLRRRSARGLDGAPPILHLPPEGFVVSKNTGVYGKDGELTRQFVQTKRDAGEAFEPLPGHAVKGESALLDADGRVLAKWVKTREDGVADLRPALEEALTRFEGKMPALVVPRISEDDLITVYPIPDLHLGMYAWGKESGENYDIDIATKIVRDSIASLVAQSRPSRHAILLGLGDYFHANGARAATPGSGHQLDVDGRWMKVKAAGAETALGLVDTVARRHGEVEVVFLPGNHDPDAAVGLTVAVSMAYRKTSRVTVNMTPAIAWYRLFGRVLLGATHGHTMKPAQMAMMLAADRPKEWGSAEHRHFFFGHVHHESAREVGAVRVESFTSPAAKDAYSAGGGWRSSRALTALTFHKSTGEIGRHRVAVGGERPRVRVRTR